MNRLERLARLIVIMSDIDDRTVEVCKLLLSTDSKDRTKIEEVLSGLISASTYERLIDEKNELDNLIVELFDEFLPWKEDNRFSNYWNKE